MMLLLVSPENLCYIHRIFFSESIYANGRKNDQFYDYLGENQWRPIKK